MIPRHFSRLPSRRALQSILAAGTRRQRLYSTNSEPRDDEDQAQSSSPEAATEAEAARASYEDYMRMLGRQQNTTKPLQPSSLGTKITGLYEPEALLKSPPKPSSISPELLMASQVHMGHAISLWNPRNSDYIYGIRQDIHIISLEVTAAYLRRAAKIVEEVARRGGIILFVGTRKGQTRTVVNAANLAGGYHVFERWTPGTLTNGQQVLNNCALKAVDVRDQEIPELKPHLDNWPPLKPDLVICLNPLENKPLLHECGSLTIPTIGIIDTDADPTRVTYPIPANDDSLRSVGLLAGVLGRAGQEGQKARIREAKADMPTYEPIAIEEITRYDNL